MQVEQININVVDVPKYIPEFLHLNYSKIPGAGLGVYATAKIKKGAFLGNYMGEKCTSDPNPSDYLFICKTSNKNFVLDGYDIERSNYTRFMNCCYNTDVDNVCVIRYTNNVDSSVFYNRSGVEIDIEGYIFFYAKRDIEVGEELLFDYGENYRTKLGIHM